MTFDEWLATQPISPISPEAHYATLAWNAALDEAKTIFEETYKKHHHEHRTTKENKTQHS